MRRFIKEPKGKTPRVWEITVVKDCTMVMHGDLGGAMQNPPPTTHKANNVGRKNEKGAEVVAQEWAENTIKKKVKGGYFEVDVRTNKPLGEKAATELNYTQPPGNFTVYKPQHNMGKALEKQLQELAALAERKRDGYMHYLVVDEHGYCRLFSSKMEPAHNLEMEDHIPWMERYPHLEKELKLINLPPKTILIGEICTSVHSHSDKLGFAVDDFEYVGGVIKSLTGKALEDQQENGNLAFCIWDVAVWMGEPWVKTKTVEARRNHTRSVLVDSRAKWLTMPEVIELYEDGFKVVSHDGSDLELEYDYDEPSEDLLEFAKSLGWEGYVVVLPDAVYGEKAFNFRGKHDRPATAAKLKPDYEADFIMRWDPDDTLGGGKIGLRGKGKKAVGVGSAQAYLLDPATGEERKVSKVGGGLSEKDVINLADPKLYPMVWQVEFKGWTAKGSLRHPNFLRVRDDKSIDECTIDQNPRWR